MCSASNDCAFRMAWTISSWSVMPTNPAIFMLVSSARGALGDGMLPSSIAARWIGSGGLASREKIAHAMRYRHWHHAAKIGGRRLGWVDRLVRDRLPRRKPKRDLKFYLAPSRYRDAEQECDKQACERSFPGNGADGRKRLSWLARRGNGLAQSVDRGAQRGGDFRDRARQIGCGIDGAFHHAGLGCRFGCFDCHDSTASKPRRGLGSRR